MTKQLGASHLGLPPPAQWTLYDADRAVGWTTDNTVGFLGFADQTEALHAAWVAHRALSRRLARDQGTRPIPVDAEPLAVQRVGDRELILGGTRAIATLVRPGEPSSSGPPNSFGFEVEIPTPASELRARAMAHLMYRTLRKSGLRWALWRPGAPGAVPSATYGARDPANAIENEVDETTISTGHQDRRRPEKRSTPPWRKPVTPSAWAALALASVSLLLLALVVPHRVGVALTVTGLAALAVFRAAAMTGRWLLRTSARESEEPTGVSHEIDLDPWDDHRNAGSCA